MLDVRNTFRCDIGGIRVNDGVNGHANGFHRLFVLRHDRAKLVLFGLHILPGSVKHPFQEIVLRAGHERRNGKLAFNAVAALGEILLFGRKTGHPLIADHLDICAEVNARPNGVAEGAFTAQALNGIPVLVRFFVAVEDVNDVFVHHVFDAVGEAFDFRFHVTEALHIVPGAVLCPGVLLRAESPVFDVVHQGAAGVDHDILGFGCFWGVQHRLHFLEVFSGQHHGAHAVNGLGAANAAFQVEHQGISPIDAVAHGQGGLADAGRSVQDHAEVLVGEVHFVTVLNHVSISFFV